ncbi:dethiobiotin synthase [Kitasatospora atroaurantiaca]|uniref:ATP-dependent dethiobiotin synthetase BioD n=1 Tax=Kitasatospora atroaurantiaca TaxID=285545 RepID=A0A561F0M5_9ACTN|nr:dethiobiotin synthase [Kitasatospora atroaurantiaca]TWE21415.1 dethiobiotin synthetase [Kitasatospora atroaurantiaca]
MTVLFVTGTGTEVGKTVVTAAVAALAGPRVAVLKPGQTGVTPGEPGDAAEVTRLAGPVTAVELARYPEPLAPDTAARRSGLPPVGPKQVAEAVAELAQRHDLVLVEGAGGLLVRYDDEGHTLADMALATADLGLPVQVLLVASAGLGTLNTTALSAEALRARGLELRGVVVGSWPAEPDLASRCNLADLPSVAGAPLLGVLPQGAAAEGGAPFLSLARAGLAPALGGGWDAADFTAAQQASRPAEGALTSGA